MKSKLIYMGLLGLAAASALTACDNDFEYPPLIKPEATMKANTSIAEFKAQYWESGRNYCSTVKERVDGEDLIISGRVVSSDSTGNIFKNVVIQDETAAITVAINAYDLYKSYQYGQEVVVNCTGLQVGGYNGLMQMGSEGTYNGAPSMTFMTQENFDSHAELNGLSNPALVVPALRTLEQIKAYKADQDSLMLYQSRLVKIDSVRFEDAGKQFAPASTVDRYVQDKAGNRLNLRCSSYSSFKNDVIPAGYGCVTGILSYYGSDWQLMLNGLDGLADFVPYDPSNDPNASEPKGSGTAADPYNVAKAIEVAIANGQDSKTNVYIAGYVKSGEINLGYGSGTWTLAEHKDGTGPDIYVYACKDFGNQKFTVADKVKVGDYIVVCGPLINFKGNTPESNFGYLYSINGKTE